MNTPARSTGEDQGAPSTRPAAETSQRALIGTGVVRHRRLRPVANAFEYRTYFLMLPMRSLRAAACAELHRNRFGLLSFHDRDHGDGRADALAWLDELLHAEGIDDADGEVWLQTYPRVLGYVFKPVSFWHCERSDGSLAAILVEVNNTFGERHCYLLADQRPEASAVPPPPGEDRQSGKASLAHEPLAYGRDLHARKVFHVSPFSHITGNYRFRFMRTAGADGARCVSRIDHEDAGGALLQTSLSGRLAPLTRASARTAFFGMPLMSFGVIARIHWQALRVRLKHVPYVKKPAPPETFVTR